MSRPAFLVLVALAAIGGWYFFRDYPLPPGANYLGQTQPPTAANTPLPGQTTGAFGSASATATPFATGQSLQIETYLPRDPRYVRVASFNIEMLSRDKSEDIRVMISLASILAQFDVVAVQGIAADNNHTLGQLVDLINSSGRQYDLAVGPRVGRDDEDLRRLAFVFDNQRVEVDKHELYTVEDPDDLLRWEPFVAWFRTRGPQPEVAFTFTLVNVQTDPDESERENSILGGVFREVRNDQRFEDDVLLMGSFGCNADQLQSFTRIPDAAWAVTDAPTDTAGTGQYDNLVCSRNFTDEFTGRTGTFDFLRRLNLSVDQAEEISTHLPVWAEFNMLEGGDLPRVTPGTTPGIGVPRQHSTRRVHL